MSRIDYEPLTPEEIEQAILDSNEKPYRSEFRSIVLAAEGLAVMVNCGNHTKDELDETAKDVFQAIHGCVPALAISILDTDDCFTSPDRMENQFGGKI